MRFGELGQGRVDLPYGAGVGADKHPESVSHFGPQYTPLTFCCQL
jgi:hypothetical protein